MSFWHLLIYNFASLFGWCVIYILFLDLMGIRTVDGWKLIFLFINPITILVFIADTLYFIAAIFRAFQKGDAKTHE